jgi:magnesium-protoporphyrin O-methyltransferase
MALDYPSLAASIEFCSGDMLDPALGEFDHVVAMDSLIHYGASDIRKALTALSHRTRQSMLFTYAPRTPLLAVMHGMGRFFPKSDRSPSLVPVARDHLLQLIQETPQLQAWREGRTERISSGFYTSQAWEWTRS